MSKSGFEYIYRNVDVNIKITIRGEKTTPKPPMQGLHIEKKSDFIAVEEYSAFYHIPQSFQLYPDDYTTCNA